MPTQVVFKMKDAFDANSFLDEMNLIYEVGDKRHYFGYSNEDLVLEVDTYFKNIDKLDFMLERLSSKEVVSIDTIKLH